MSGPWGIVGSGIAPFRGGGVQDLTEAINDRISCIFHNAQTGGGPGGVSAPFSNATAAWPGRFSVTVLPVFEVRIACDPADCRTTAVAP